MASRDNHSADDHTCSLACFDAAISECRSALNEHPDASPERAMLLKALALSLRRRFGQSQQLVDLDEAADLYRQSLTMLPSDHELRPSLLSQWGFTLHTHFHHSQNVSDIVEALIHHREALELLPDGHPQQLVVLRNIVATLLCKHHPPLEAFELDEAVALSRTIVELSPSNKDSHHRLGQLLLRRFQDSRQQKDFDEAVGVHRTLEILCLDDSEGFDILNTVAATLSYVFDNTGEVQVLDEAVALSHKVATMSASDDDSRLRLGRLLLQRFKSSAKQLEFDDAVAVHEALELLYPDDENVRSLNALAIIAWVDGTGELSVLDEVILILRRILNDPQRSSEASLVKANLAAALLSRYELNHDDQDLEEAGPLFREALRQLPSGPVRRLALEKMAHILEHQMNGVDRTEKLNEAISLLYEHISVADGDGHRQASSLKKLARLLHRRFMRSVKHDAQDLDNAIVLLREVIKSLLPTDPARHDAAHELALVLASRFHHSGDSSFLDEAIQLENGALSATPHPPRLRSKFVHGLADIMYQKYHSSHQLEDLDKCISLNVEALSLLGPQDYKESIHYAMAQALLLRYQRSHSAEDLNVAISICRKALLEVDPTRHHHSTMFSILASLLSARFGLTKQISDLNEATSAFASTVTCEFQPVAQRFFSAQAWAEFADANGHESALEAYGLAIGFLPRIAMLGLDLSSRQLVLTAIVDGVARDATACAIREGNFERAVEFIEEGRAIFWSQALQLRAPLDHLRSKAPELVEHIQVISNRLEQESLRGVSKAAPMPHDAARAVEEQSRELLGLNDQWLGCLEKVRSIEGYESFLLPKKYSDLRLAAVHGPVVILNATKSRRDALILRTPETDVLHVPLVLLTGDAEQQLVRLRSLLSGAYPRSRGDRGMRFKGPLVDSDTIIKRGLAILWTTVVEPIIRALDLKKSASPPRIWWCPSGSFNSLPIHAAGIYDHREGQCVSDYVISSYIPTLTTLLGRPPPNVDSFKMLVVIQPNSKHHEPIPYATEELRRIEKIVDNDVLVRYGIQDAPALVSDVLSAIPTATILHFACHGVQVSAEPARQGYQAVKSNPLNSALILEDGSMKLTEIMELSLKNKSLVFLSACQTATGDETLPDESMHLSATMLFAGFQGVVGTLWSIDDRDGPEVAEAFYRHLFSSSQPSRGSQVVPDTAEAARALHLAVRKLREKEQSFMRWVPFIHLGF
ncbi:hypothetical protein JAAARDRAFT_191640 [Jaapia argillacea MUCL 33604]|uniref:CHAT domain-containing protein n=1 Tax=Jaapia argillacea MUCL 33604 TaxID=933084 RepID=A0A067Q9P2_9AGAM|nr:hypothetical protein JAAARDRAFT_191640 [Jaapia argillacea MUCL 33604]